MKVVVARHAGVCYGVERAFKLARNATAQGGPVYSLGPLIHNPQAVEQLRENGVEIADSVDDVTAGTLVIRTHGVAPDIIDQAREHGLSIVDATCPHVSKAQNSARALASEGYQVVILGEADHPEVAGIKAYAGKDAIVVSSADELPARFANKRIGLVVQTTQSLGVLQDVVKSLLPRAQELRVHNTICNATTQRQQAALELARDVDVVVVVGGHNSGNTSRLVDICLSVNPCTHHVETADELERSWFENAEVVGITAGASTPGEQMQGVIDVIKEMDA